MMIGEGPPFPAAYVARELDEFPSGAVVIELRPSGQSDPGGLIFEVDPHVTDSWVGFARPGPARVVHAASGLVPTPNPTQLCAIARGTAYLVDVRDHKYCLASDPVVAVAALRAARLLLLATPWLVVAIGREGVAWRTGRLAIDGLRLDETDRSRVIGVADPDSAEPREFAIDLETGEHEGGAVVAP